MTDEDIDKLFEAEFGKNPKHIGFNHQDLRMEGFRAAMKSDAAQKAIRAAMVAAMREAEIICSAEILPSEDGVRENSYLETALRCAAAIRRRADEMERSP